MCPLGARTRHARAQPHTTQRGRCGAVAQTMLRCTSDVHACAMDNKTECNMAMGEAMRTTREPRLREGNTQSW
eukprot:10200600-Alexandrium_andersonii.AAC.1